MPQHPYDYAIVRVVPRIDRGEFINVGVFVFSPTQSYLGYRIELDRERLQALSPGADIESIATHLSGLTAVCEGDAGAGPVAQLPLGERFHWLVHPRSAVLQTSAVHSGTSEDLSATLQALFVALVA